MKLFVTILLLDAKLLQHCALIFASLEVARMTCKLDPLVPAVLERLDEWGPLNHAAQLAPTRRLKKKKR